MARKMYGIHPKDLLFNFRNQYKAHTWKKSRRQMVRVREFFRYRSHEFFRCYKLFRYLKNSSWKEPTALIFKASWWCGMPSKRHSLSIDFMPNSSNQSSTTTRCERYVVNLTTYLFRKTLYYTSERDRWSLRYNFPRALEGSNNDSFKGLEIFSHI